MADFVGRERTGRRKQPTEWTPPGRAAAILQSRAPWALVGFRRCHIAFRSGVNSGLDQGLGRHLRTANLSAPPTYSPASGAVPADGLPNGSCSNACSNAAPSTKVHQDPYIALTCDFMK